MQNEIRRCVWAPLFLFMLMGAWASAVWAAPSAGPVAKSSDQRFLDHGDVIEDTQTRLMWFKRDFWQLEGRHLNWYQATEFLQKVNSKKYYGYGDWRLPTPEEAATLYERNKRNADKDGDKLFIDRIFPKGSGWSTWTSKESGPEAEVVSYKDEGGSGSEDKINGPDAFLRPVRSIK